MVESPTTQRWIGRAGFAVLVLVLIFLQLLPLDTAPSHFAGPDLAVAATLAYVARRPDLVPVWMVAGMVFLADLMLGRPPGLWTALMLILTEMIRARAGDLRSAPFTIEWFTMAVGLALATFANRAVLAIVISGQSPLGLTLVQMLATIVTYPLVVVVLHLVFGISRPAPGEVDSRGQKI